MTDHCRWRKRTRFLANFPSCWRQIFVASAHIRLTGYSKEFRCCWTKAAEAYYPKPLAKYSAVAVVESLKPIARRRAFDPAACGRAGNKRIGEASNPSPRRYEVGELADLEAVRLLQPGTVAWQAKVQKLFLDWLQDELSTAESSYFLRRFISRERPFTFIDTC